MTSRSGTRGSEPGRRRSAVIARVIIVVLFTPIMAGTPPSDEERRRIAEARKEKKRQLEERRRLEDLELEESTARDLAELERRRVIDAEADRKRKRAEEDAMIKKRRDEEDAKLEAARRKTVPGGVDDAMVVRGPVYAPTAMSRLRPLARGRGTSSTARTSSATTTARAPSSSSMARTSSLGDTPRSRDHSSFLRRSPSVVSSACEVEFTDPPTTVRPSRKRTADDERSSRSASNSSKRQRRSGVRRSAALRRGQTCKRCRIMGYRCDPPTPGGRRKICEQCRHAKTACLSDDGVGEGEPRSIAEAATDSAWGDRGRGGDRVFGPVSDPLIGFEDTGSDLWARWMDINTRIHLQTAETIERVRVEIAIQRRHVLLNAQANMLSALVNFRTTAGDRRANDPEWYKTVRRDFLDATGMDLGDDGGTFPWHNAEDDGPVASGSGVEHEVEMIDADVAEGGAGEDGEHEDPDAEEAGDEADQ